MIITLERPSTIDIKEWLGLRLFAAPTLKTQPMMPEKPLEFGQRRQDWVASEEVEIDGVAVRFPDHTRNLVFEGRTCELPVRLFRNDTVTVSFDWSGM